MKNDDKPESIAIVPSIPRYIIGIIVGVVSLILGGFLIPEPTWLADHHPGAWCDPIDHLGSPYASGASALSVKVEQSCSSKPIMDRHEFLSNISTALERAEPPSNVGPSPVRYPDLSDAQIVADVTRADVAGAFFGVACRRGGCFGDRGLERASCRDY